MEILGLAAFQGRRRETHTVRMTRSRLTRGRSECVQQPPAIAGPIVSTRLTIKDQITHLWLIIVDPITYLSHSTTMETPHKGFACV